MTFRAIAVFALSLLPLAAQSWDTSGNSLLNGTHYFRHVVYVTDGTYGNYSRAIAVYGQIAYSGTGTYSITAVVNDSNSNSLQNFTNSGTYAISASGYGTVSNPLASGAMIYGSVSNGTFIGSSTEDGFNDFFISSKLSSTSSGTSVLRGNYTLAYYGLLGSQYYYTYDAGIQMSPDGAGNLGNVRISAYIGSNGSTPTTQTISGVKYVFSNGAINMQFPKNSNNLLYGNEYLYVSADGNFVFGGSPDDYDFFVGVRNPGSAPGLSGLYYQGGIDMDTSTASAGYGTLSTWYGTFSAGGGKIVGHQRTVDGFNLTPFDSTYPDTYSVNTDGTYTDAATYTNYFVGSGNIRIGVGIGPFLGISVAVPVPAFSGDGVYLNPAGVLNAASSAPFTAGIAPGELITLYGSNLAASTVIAPGIPFPTALGNTQIKINGTPAPIYYVSPTQVSVIVPYGVNTSIASIQAVNNGTASNTVSLYTNSTVPGVFTNPVGGLGYAAALHAADNSLVTAANPAQAGEYLSVYVTGLGAVTPTVTDGAAGPVNPLSTTTNSISVSLGGVGATISYAGLAPQLAGLYQINFQVPTGLTNGNLTLSVSGPDSVTTESLIPYGQATSPFAPTVLRPQSRPLRLAPPVLRRSTGEPGSTARPVPSLRVP